ncbi:hypothetical protein [Psychromonas aquimarina]|uniref:hypothetical protein n=1 Tax=Psychromonas aquimarina TaxID=444919 RepID=UPI000404C420|nr:hypothetical protein [Psychromonas aquimarina]
MNKTNISLILSITALSVTLYNTLQPAPEIVREYPPQELVFHTTGNEKQAPAGSSDEITALKKQISLLKKRAAQLSAQSSSGLLVDNEQFKDAVLDIIAFKEQQERQAFNEQNPIYSFYDDLPKDYDTRIKTDPDYLQQVSKELRAKILDESQPEVERVAAMSQLQMTMYTLNRPNMAGYDYETVDAIIDISKNTQDEKLKVQAIEVAANSAITDKRIADSLIAMIETEQNDYARGMAVQGLISQYYQAQDTQSEFRKEVAQDILNLYNNSGDQQLKSLLENMLGDEKAQLQLREHAGQ